MKIAFVVGRFPVISETFILNQITGLIELGHTVDIYADEPGHDAGAHPDVSRYDLRTHTPYFGLRGSRGRYALPAVRAWLRRAVTGLPRRPSVRSDGPATRYPLRLLYAANAFRGQGPYQIVHCHFGQHGADAVQLREMGSLTGRVVTSFHGWDVNVYPRRCPANPYERLFRAGDLFTANSDHTTRKLLALGCPPERLVKHAVGVDLRRFPFRPRRLKNEEPVEVLTVARLVPEKGVDLSVQAVARIIRGPTPVPVRYTVVGDGPLRPALAALTRQLGVADHVRLVGWLDQDVVAELYGRAHLFVLASRRTPDGAEEAAGVALLEAQASGLPVVATRVGGIPEVVRDGESGFLVPERDVDALEKALRELLAGPATWSELGGRGRAHVAEHFDLDRLNRRLVRIYDALQDGRGWPA